jgi:cytidine deaminase
MIDKLLELHKNSYVPISHFPVSACVVTKDGREFYGVNVEDASTRAGTCAERAAIFNAITAGVKIGEFKEVNVMVSSGEIGMPCFVCRQMISELFEEDCIVRCYSTKGNYVEHTVKELCPYPFGEDDLV